MVWFWIAFIIYLALPFAVMLAQFRRPSKGVAWAFITLALPYIGFLAYMMLSAVYRRSRQQAEHQEQNAAEAVLSEMGGVDRRLLRLLGHIPGTSFSAGNRVTVLSDGQVFYDAMLQAIERASEEINFQFYILRDDQLGSMFLRALQKKAREGVKVRVLVDGVGSHNLSSAYISKLKESGAEFHFFLPFVKSFLDRRLNYRNHRKNVVIDGKIGFFGGFNVGDEYVGKDPKLGYWRDTQLSVEGEAARVLRRQFLKDWQYASGKVLDLLMPEKQTEQPAAEDGIVMQLIASGPDEISDSAYEAYYGAISAAKNRVYVETPYLIPDSGLATSLKIAARSGVDVQIIIPGVSDHPIVHWATLSFAEDLVRAGVKVYRYRAGFMHAKVMLIDDTLAIVGSVNVDVRSFFANFELSAIMFEKTVIERLSSDFAQDLAVSEEVVLADFLRRSALQSARERLARLFSPLF